MIVPPEYKMIRVYWDFKSSRSTGWNIVRQFCNLEMVGGHGIQDGEWKSVQTLKEVGSLTHERIRESVEIGIVPRLLYENVRGVGFTTDMRDRNGSFVDLFACIVLL